MCIIKSKIMYLEGLGLCVENGYFNLMEHIINQHLMYQWEVAYLLILGAFLLIMF